MFWALYGNFCDTIGIFEQLFAHTTEFSAIFVA
jgi:hypothetical protein